MLEKRQDPWHSAALTKLVGLGLANLHKILWQISFLFKKANQAKIIALR
jgi:hypothetical protein